MGGDVVQRTQELLKRKEMKINEIKTQQNEKYDFKPTTNKKGKATSEDSYAAGDRLYSNAVQTQKKLEKKALEEKEKEYTQHSYQPKTNHRSSAYSSAGGAKR